MFWNTGRVKFSDKSVVEDICANLFLHFFFSWRKGLLCLALWVRQHLAHHNCPHTSIPDLLKLVSAQHTGFGNCKPLVCMREEGREINLTTAQQQTSSWGSCWKPLHFTDPLLLSMAHWGLPMCFMKLVQEEAIHSRAAPSDTGVVSGSGHAGAI